MFMTKLTTALALAGFVALGAGAPAQAQERALRAITSGEPAPLNKAMTERQARRSCEMQLKTARGAEKRQKMSLCINQAMQGN